MTPTSPLAPNHRGRAATWLRPLPRRPLPSLEDRLPVAVVAALAALFAVQALLAVS